MEVVGAPVDVGVDLRQPWFSKNKVVFFEVVEKGLEVIRIVVAVEGDGSSVSSDGGAVRENDGDGLAWLKRNGVLFLK